MQAENEKHLSRLSYALLARLTELYDKFRERGELSPDGSFWQSSKHLSNWLHCSIGGLRWARNILIETNKIRYEQGVSRGIASRYWIVGKKQKQKPQEPEPQVPIFQGTGKGYSTS